MNLLDMLRRLGDRLGLLELAPDPEQPSSPVKVQTRSITLEELIMTIQIMEVRELAAQPAELLVSFDKIFEAAGIQAPTNGWTVDRLLNFLSTERIRHMNHDEAQRETLNTLAAEKVDAADVVKDAISRDRALDAFEESVVKKRQQWQTERTKLLAQLKERQRQLEQEIDAEEKKWREWRRQKRQRELDMARAVGYLIDKPVISIGEE
jgi:flagellar motility protein MotE (MotC chaperone)